MVNKQTHFRLRKNAVKWNQYEGELGRPSLERKSRKASRERALNWNLEKEEDQPVKRDDRRNDIYSIKYKRISMLEDKESHGHPPFDGQF